MIRLDILFTIATEINDSASGEVDIVANKPGAPGGGQKLWERAVPGLIRTQCRNQRIAVENGTSIVPEANGAPIVTTGLSSVKYKL